uniref:Uncharacterized protein n=1 Tax=Megaselia scalaris TaxID=36166 RepID=T1H4A7_MEGSC
IECDRIQIRARLLNRNSRLVNLKKSHKKRGVFHNHAGLILQPQHKIYGLTPLAAPIGHAHVTHTAHGAKFSLPHAHVQKFHKHIPLPSAVLPAVNVPHFHQHVDVPVAAPIAPHPVVETPSVGEAALAQPIQPPVSNVHPIPFTPEVHHHAAIIPQGIHHHAAIIPQGIHHAAIIPQEHHHASSVYATSGGVIGGQPFILRPGNAVVQSYNVNYARPVAHAHIPVAHAHVPVAHAPVAHTPVAVAETPIQFAHTPVSAVASAPIFPSPSVVSISGHHNYFVPRPVAAAPVAPVAPAFPVFPSPSAAPAFPVFPSPSAAPALPVAPSQPVFPSPTPAVPVFPSPAPAPSFPATPVFPAPRPFIPSPVAPPQRPIFSLPVPQNPFFIGQGLPEATPTVLSERPIVVPDSQQPEIPSSFPELPASFPSGPGASFPSGGSDILPGQIPSQGSDILPGQIPAQPPFQNVPHNHGHQVFSILSPQLYLISPQMPNNLLLNYHQFMVTLNQALVVHLATIIQTQTSTRNGNLFEELVADKKLESNCT